MDYASNKKECLQFRKTLRHSLTPAEATLWMNLKNNKICNVRWRRQFSIGRYILDFYCPAAKLAVELDGKEHYTMEGDRYDNIRDYIITSKGIKILRYENCEIWNSLEKVIEDINEEIVQRVPRRGREFD